MQNTKTEAGARQFAAPARIDPVWECLSRVKDKITSWLVYVDQKATSVHDEGIFLCSMWASTKTDAKKHNNNNIKFGCRHGAGV